MPSSGAPRGIPSRLSRLGYSFRRLLTPHQLQDPTYSQLFFVGSNFVQPDEYRQVGEIPLSSSADELCMQLLPPYQLHALPVFVRSSKEHVQANEGRRTSSNIHRHCLTADGQTRPRQSCPELPAGQHQEQQDELTPACEPPTLSRELFEAFSKLGVSSTCKKGSRRQQDDQQKRALHI
jgi:hypothetical protein